MADLIDRQDVPDTNVGDMISRQAAIDAVRSYYDECDEQEESIEERIERLPSVDAVEVVRCKDCKYRDADDFCTGRGYPNVLVPDDGFCDKGERRE